MLVSDVETINAIADGHATGATARDDELDLVGRLRLAAGTLSSPEEARRRAVDTGLGLGLPRVWLEALPTIDLLPECYRDGPGPDDRYGPDSSLRFKALERAAALFRAARGGRSAAEEGQR
ncbi:hypothetical protein [Azospirillum argentinense]